MTILARKDFSDYEFIIRELDRMLKLQPKELIGHWKHHPEDGLAKLPKPGRGYFPFTREGERRFYQIALRGLRAMGSSGRKHHLPEVTKKLKAEFVERQLAGVSISEQNAHEIFETSVAAIAATHVPLVHFIPCSIVSHEQPPNFKIGPVGFILSKTFLKENDSALRESRNLARGPQWGWEELQRFFGEFHWVAIVSIDACDQTVSQHRARKIVQLGLDLFKLFIGSARASDVRQAYDPGTPTASAALTYSQPDGFSFSWSRKMHDAIVVDHWHSAISSWKAWVLGEAMVESYSKTWDNLPELLQRFLDGLTWHGEAVIDAEPQSRLVRFWIAIERVVSLRSGDNITRRAALLSSRGRLDFANQCKKCDQLYGKRSSVIHGSAARASKDFTAYASSVEELSKTVLTSYLSIVENLQRGGRASIEALRLELERLQSQFESAR